MSKKDDPYGDVKTYHKADKISPSGSVSALCFPTSRPIRGRGQTWTLRDEAVTCKRCRKKLAAKNTEVPHAD